MKRKLLLILNNKKYYGRLIFVLVLIGLFAFFYNRYRHYINQKNIDYLSLSMTLSNSIDNYQSKFLKDPSTINELVKYIIENESEDSTTISKILDSNKSRIISIDSSIYLYLFGPNQKDDELKIAITPDDFNFFNFNMKVGDILLTKTKKTKYRLSEKLKKISIFKGYDLIVNKQLSKYIADYLNKFVTNHSSINSNDSIYSTKLVILGIYNLKSGIDKRILYNEIGKKLNEKVLIEQTNFKLSRFESDFDSILIPLYFKESILPLK
jgi:hypothetical protein